MAALILAPLSKFGDIAANSFMLAMFRDYNLSLRSKTFAASLCAALWRAVIMPVDTVKTMMQVKGEGAISALQEQFAQQGFASFYQGAISASFACLVGHFPWFLAFNTLSSMFPENDDDDDANDSGHSKHLRRATLGFLSSAFSDTCSNGFKVLKTIKQTSVTPMTYSEAFMTASKTEGIFIFWTRGLATKIICNGVGAMLFTVVWKYIEDLWFRCKGKNCARKKASPFPDKGDLPPAVR